MGQKTGGRTNGWINYTLSRAYRWFPDGSINQGRRFPAKYDSRHMLNLVLLHKFSNFFDISATWTFNNGFYTTQPLERYNTPTHLPGEKGEEKKDIIFHIEKRNNMKNTRLSSSGFRIQFPSPSKTWNFHLEYKPVQCLL